MPDYLMGEFNGGCTTADGCRERPLLAAILQEANGSELSGAGVLYLGAKMPPYPRVRSNEVLGRPAP